MLEKGALNPYSVLCTDQAPSPAFSALNQGSSLNPRTLNPGTTVVFALDALPVKHVGVLPNPLVGHPFRTQEDGAPTVKHVSVSFSTPPQIVPHNR